MKNKLIGTLAVLIIVVSPIFGFVGCNEANGSAPLPPQARIRVATTTSLYDTGLWGYLEPLFEKEYNVELDVIYAGTGKALEFGKRGDVDVITVHAKSREEQFIEEGYGVERIPFTYNYFLIVGPQSDPAGINGLSPEAAFKKLMEIGDSSFVSRGDDSGTHSKEKEIWKSAGFDYEIVQKTGVWYIEAGQGMGPTLVIANEKQAYTLTDMGTFLTYRSELELVPIVDSGELLLNVYSVIVCNLENNSNVNVDMANNLANFLTSPDIQELIGNYGVKEYGLQLFIPYAGVEPK
jgi:tungstate transport system substrate-binding protein